jgi:hypothetical protein
MLVTSQRRSSAREERGRTWKAGTLSSQPSPCRAPSFTSSSHTSSSPSPNAATPTAHSSFDLLLRRRSDDKTPTSSTTPNDDDCPTNERLHPPLIFTRHYQDGLISETTLYTWYVEPPLDIPSTSTERAGKSSSPSPILSLSLPGPSRLDVYFCPSLGISSTFSLAHSQPALASLSPP